LNPILDPLPAAPNATAANVALTPSHNLLDPPFRIAERTAEASRDDA
jgi:hypothetical protein